MLNTRVQTKFTGSGNNGAKKFKIKYICQYKHSNTSHNIGFKNLILVKCESLLQRPIFETTCNVMEFYDS